MEKRARRFARYVPGPLVDGGATFSKAEKSGEGTWKLNACPMDGGGIAVGPDAKAAAVWRRMETIFLTYPGKPEQELGAVKDAAIAWGRGRNIHGVERAGRIARRDSWQLRSGASALEGSLRSSCGRGPGICGWDRKAAL